MPLFSDLGPQGTRAKEAVRHCGPAGGAERHTCQGDVPDRGWSTGDPGHPHKWTGNAPSHEGGLCASRLLEPSHILHKLAPALTDPSIIIREDLLEEVAFPLGFTWGERRGGLPGGQLRIVLPLWPAPWNHLAALSLAARSQGFRVLTQQTPVVPSPMRGLGRHHSSSLTEPTVERRKQQRRNSKSYEGKDRVLWQARFGGVGGQHWAGS